MTTSPELIIEPDARLVRHTVFLDTRHVAILKVEPAGDRSVVTMRGLSTHQNPSGIEAVYTPLLTTDEGQSITADLSRRQIVFGPLSFRRPTAVRIATEELPDGTLIRVIHEVSTASASLEGK